MPVLHVIDAARIVHESCRIFFPENKSRFVTATWGDLPEDQRQLLIDDVQQMVDGKTPITTHDSSRFVAAVVDALRPFLSE